MKLKLATLATAALAGIGASVALAHDGDGHHGAKCHEVHFTGTLAAQAFSLTVTKANHTTAQAGATVSLALPDGTKAKVEACQTGTGAAATFTVRGVELHVKQPKQTPTTSSTTTP